MKKHLHIIACILAISIHALSQQKIIVTIAGSQTPSGSPIGIGGPALDAILPDINNICLDNAGNVYVSCYFYNQCWKIKTTSDTAYIELIAGNGTTGFYGDGGLAVNAELAGPTSIAVGKSGKIYIVDAANHRIRMVNASGVISTIAGNGSAVYNGENIAATSAGLVSPSDVRVDDSNNVYIADAGANRVRKVSALTHLINTIAGNGIAGFGGDGGFADTSRLNGPTFISLDKNSNVYIVDDQNVRIRKINAATGIITTVTGNGLTGDMGDGGLATSAEIDQIEGLTVDDSGNIYFGDNSFRPVVREVFAASGLIYRVAGNPSAYNLGDGGPPLNCEIEQVQGVAVDDSGDIYIADSPIGRIRKVTKYDTLKGYIYKDKNADCIYDIGDSAVAGITVKAVLNGEIAGTAITDNNGEYIFYKLELGHFYNIEIDSLVSPGYMATCPLSGIVTDTVNTDSVNIAVKNRCFINNYTEPICIVSIDTATNKCEIMWGRTNSPPSGGFGSYNIYKDTGSGSYGLIHNQPLDSLSEFMDNSSNPSLSAQSYEISTTDSCGESVLSAPHTSIVLTTIQATNAYVLNWTPYIGFTPVVYRIFRGTSMSTLVQIDSVANNIFTYTDSFPPINSYYLLEAVNPSNTCIPSTHRPVNHAISIPLLSGSFSNGFNTTALGINVVGNTAININIYPNPSKGIFTLNYSMTKNDNIQISIVNEFGQEVYTKQKLNVYGKNTEQLDLKNLASGIYSLRMQTNNGITVKKLMIIGGQ